MPVYLFTFHAYRSWMPDRKRGFVRRHEGLLPPDPKLAAKYRERAAHDEVEFDDAQSWAMIAETAKLCGEIDLHLHEVAVVASHIHTLVSWRSELKSLQVAARLKQRQGRALSVLLNRPGPWFSRGRSRKRVRNREHFDRLMKSYLPNHGRIRYTLWDGRN